MENDYKMRRCSNKEIKWNFIVEMAPWMGGFYERLVGLVKKALRKTLGRKLLTLIQLQTLLKRSRICCEFPSIGVCWCGY